MSRREALLQNDMRWLSHSNDNTAIIVFRPNHQHWPHLKMMYRHNTAENKCHSSNEFGELSSDIMVYCGDIIREGAAKRLSRCVNSACSRPLWQNHFDFGLALNTICRPPFHLSSSIAYIASISASLRSLPRLPSRVPLLAYCERRNAEL